MSNRKRNEHLNVRLTKEENLRLKLKAEVQQKSVSELVRELAK